MVEHDNLEEFADGRTYDLLDSSDTGVAFYRGLAQETGGPVLELACGTGRVSIPIAQLGIAVTGVDVAPSMLAQARSKSNGLPVRWIEGDARTFDLDEQFRLIFLTGNAFQAFLTRADQEALLQRVYAHLPDEGLFAFETRNPHWSGMEMRVGGEGLFAHLETDIREKPGQSYVDLAGQRVRVARTQVYDPIAQILHWTTFHRVGEGEQTKVTRIALRFTFPQELVALLHYNGFTVLRQYGDWNLEPLSATSPSIISVCGKRVGARA